MESVGAAQIGSRSRHVEAVLVQKREAVAAAVSRLKQLEAALEDMDRQLDEVGRAAVSVDLSAAPAAPPAAQKRGGGGKKRQHRKKANDAGSRPSPPPPQECPADAGDSGEEEADDRTPAERLADLAQQRKALAAQRALRCIYELCCDQPASE